MLMYKICLTCNSTILFLFAALLIIYGNYSFTVQSLFNSKHEQYIVTFFSFVNLWNHLPEEIVSDSG